MLITDAAVDVPAAEEKAYILLAALIFLTYLFRNFYFSLLSIVFANGLNFSSVCIIFIDKMIFSLSYQAISNNSVHKPLTTTIQPTLIFTLIVF